MIRNASWWKSLAVVLMVGVLAAGCGKGKQSPDADIDANGTGTDLPGDGGDNPTDRTGEDTNWTDPNKEYASILKPVHFDFNRYRINDEDKPTLEGIASLLNKNTGFKVLIEGHCDERGTNEYNITLGEQRALATKRYLVSLGVDEARFQTVSYGEERPADFGGNEAAFAANRRAEFKVEAPRS